MGTESLKNTYNQFLQLSTGKSITPTANSSVNQTSPASNTQYPPDYYTNSLNQPIAIVSLNEQNKRGNGGLTAAVAAIAITGGAIGVLLGKGPATGFYKKINSWMQKLDDKIFDYSTKYKTLSTVQKWYLTFQQGLHHMLSSLKMCNNITAVKDSGFKWLCDKLYLTKPMNWVTSQFKKITIGSSAKAYEKARNIADNNIAKLREYIPILKQKNPEAAQQLEQLINGLEKDISNLANATNRGDRLKFIEKATKDIGDKVDADLAEILKNPTKENLSKLKIYRTEINAAKGKDQLTNILQEAQRSCTFNIEDKHKIMSEAKDEIALALKAGDTSTRSTLRKLSKQLDSYKNLAGKDEKDLRDKLVEEMKSTVSNIKKALNDPTYSKENKEILRSNIEKINSILKTTEEKGKIEDILGILNEHFKASTPKEYSAAKDLTQEIRKAINKACDNELKMYDKFAEYSVGSAPTDAVGLILPVGLAGYAISKGDNKDEKISATLKAGIPITGGVATTFIAAAKMLTNMQGLLLGLGAGFALNAIGSKADDSYKAYTEDKQFAKKAIAAYKASLSKNEA